MADDFELVPADDDFELVPEGPSSFASGAPGGGAARVHEHRPLPPRAAVTSALETESPVARTADTMSELERMSRFDPEMAQFQVLSTEEGRKDFTKAAKRLPGNTVKSIGAMTTEMASGAEEYLAAKLAETNQRHADEAREAARQPFKLFNPNTWHSDSELERIARAHQRTVKSNLEAMDVATERAQAAREGGAEAVPADAGPGERAIQSGLASAAVSVPAIAVAGPVGGSALMGVGTAAQRRSQLLAQGVPEADANQSAAFMGSLEALTEFIPAHSLVKKFPGFSQHLAEFMLSELPGENINSVAQLVDDYRLGLRDDVTMQDILDSVRDTTLATAAGSAAQVGGVHMTQVMVDAANARAAARAAGGAVPPGPSGGPAAGGGAGAPPAPTHSQQKGKVRQEPTLSEPDYVPRGTPGEPTFGNNAAGENLAAVPGDQGAQATERAAKAPVEKLGETPAAAKISQPRGKDWEELQAVKDGTATPEAVARLERQGLVIRSETNVPRLLPAGRRRLTELEEAAKPKPVPPEAGLDHPEALQERLKSDQPLRDSLKAMAGEAGWAEEGGHLMRHAETGEVTGRTSWIPNAEWWPDRPSGFNEQDVRDSVGRALAGEKLGKRDTRLIEFMRDVHDERHKLEAYLPDAQDMPDLNDRYETAMVARASELDEGAVERLAIQHDDDRGAFLRGVKELLDGHDNPRPAAVSEAGPQAQKETQLTPERTSRVRLTPEERLAQGREAIARTEQFGRDLEAARAATHTTPTFAQIKAGNYAKGTLQFGGMQIALENPAGSTRHGYDEQGNKTWSREMTHDYGYVKGTNGNDGDQVDVFLAGAPDTGKVFVVNQVNPNTGAFDEHKAILGAHTRQEAERIYKSHYPKGWKGLGSMTELPTGDFRQWLAKGNTKRPLDRRANTGKRQRVTEMSPEQLRSALLSHELTGIPNRRAYDEAPRKATQVSVDVDSLKWVNDNMGHESGNELLKAVATTLKDETSDAFHISGDEFVVQADTPEAGHEVMKRAAERLRNATIEVQMPDGTVRTVKGLGLSYGVGSTLDEADANLQTHKTEREASGQRAARGEAPPGARRALREGREDQAGGVAEEVAAPTGARFSRRDLIQTPEFRRWFDGSKVVNEDGSPLAVYHGTTASFDQFKVRSKGRELGFHFGTKEAAQVRFQKQAGGPRSGAQVMPVYLAIRNPLRVPDSGNFTPYRLLHGFDEKTKKGFPGPLQSLGVLTQEQVDAIDAASRDPHDYYEKRARAMLVEMLEAKGYDGLVYENKYEDKGHESWVALRPTQIKSAIGNVGTYDATNPDVRFSRRPTFYSQAIRSVEELAQNKASGEQWWATISKRPGIKTEELDWMGLREWLDRFGKEKVTKKDLLEFMEANRIHVQEQLSGTMAQSDPRVQEMIRLTEGLRAKQWGIYFDSETGALDEVVSPTNEHYFAYLSEVDIGTPKSLDTVPDPDVRATLARIEALAQEVGEVNTEGATGGRYEEYTLEGGSNYRELLLTLPLPKDIPTLAQLAPPITELPPEYEFIHDTRQAGPGWGALEKADLWGVIKVGQGHANPISGWQSTQEEARAQALHQLNMSRKYEASHELEKLKAGRVFQSGHFASPNIVAHVRMTDRVDMQGQRVLFVEEVQSDWHQQGRKHGYADPAHAGRLKELKAIADEAGARAREVVRSEDNLGFDHSKEAMKALLLHDDWKQRWDVSEPDRAVIDEWRAKNADYVALKRTVEKAIPNAPFKTSWHELAMKRVIRWAAEHGYERVAWTTGKQQTDRYSLGQVIESASWELADDGTKTIELRVRTGSRNTGHTTRLQVDIDDKGLITGDSTDGTDTQYAGHHISELVGQHAADRIMRSKEGQARDLEVEIDSEGMKGFYDEILPRSVGKYVKKWGSQVGPIDMRLHSDQMNGYLAMEIAGIPREQRDEHWANLNDRERTALIEGARVSQSPHANVGVHGFDVTPEMRAAALEGQPLFARRTTPIEQWELTQFADQVKKDLGLEEFDLRARQNGDIDLELLVVRKEDRKVANGIGGLGSVAMQRLVDYAESRNARITLTTASRDVGGGYGTTSKGRLERFYRRFGFVSNRGRNHKPELSLYASMYREPREPSWARAKRSFNDWFGESKVVDPLGNPLRVFHGTNQALEKFELTRGGKATSAHSAPHGLFFTSSPAIASEYAENAGRHVHADVDNFERQIAQFQREAEAATRRGDWKTYERVVAQWEELEIGSSRDELTGQNIFPAYLKMENPLEVDFKGGTPGMPGDEKNLVALIERAKKEGRDGVILRNLVDSPKNSEASDQYVVFSPEQVRSSITLKRETQTPGRGLPAEQVREAVARAIGRARLSHVPNVEVVQTHKELPAALRDQLEREGATDTTGAVFLPGVHGDRVILIASNNATENEVHENVYHELVGHYGLTQIMDAERYNEIMDGIYRDMPERVRESARRNGLDLKDEQQRRAAAEEVIAYAAGEMLAGNKPAPEVLPWWRQVLEHIRSFLRRVFGKERFDDAAIARIVEASTKALQGQQAGIHKSLSLGALRHQRPPLYYSQLFNAVNDPKVANVAPPGEYAKIIASKSGKDVKPDEVEWSGVVNYLENLTWGQLVWDRSGVMEGLTVPDELKAPIARFNALQEWQKKYLMYKGEATPEFLDEAIAAGRALGHAPRSEIVNPETNAPPMQKHLGIRGGIEHELTQLRDVTLNMKPKRIPKSVVLDYLNKNQVDIEAMPSLLEEPDVDWINSSDALDQVAEFDVAQAQELFDQNTTDEAVREYAITMIKGEPWKYLDEEDFAELPEGMPVEKHVTDEMVERALQNSNALTDAREKMWGTYRRTAEIEHSWDPYTTYTAQHSLGYYAVMEGNKDGWSGHFGGDLHPDEYVDGETLGEVEGHLRRIARKRMPSKINTRYASYTVPGGKDYGEQLFVWNNPKQGYQFSSSHWDTEEVLLHMRYDTRQGEGGAKTLLIDEIQSDWHQKVRDELAAPDAAEQARLDREDYGFKYREHWAGDEAQDLQSTNYRERTRAWLESLPMTPDRIRAMLTKHKTMSGIDAPAHSFLFEFIAREIEKDPVLPALSPGQLRARGRPDSQEVDPIQRKDLVPDKVLDWQKFVTWLGWRDAWHETKMMKAIADGDTQALALKFNEYSLLGGGYASNSLGAVPPMARQAHALQYALDGILPIIGPMTRGQDAFSMWSEITPEMADNPNVARQIREMAPHREAFAKAWEAMQAADKLHTPESFNKLVELEDQFAAQTKVRWSDYANRIHSIFESLRTSKNMPRLDSSLMDGLTRVHLELAETGQKIYDTYVKDSYQEKQKVKVPPLDKSWPLAALKWAIRHAAENGHTQIALWPGSVHGVRWGATRAYDRVNVYPETVGDSRVMASNTNSAVVFDPVVSELPPETPVVRLRLFGKGQNGMIDVVTTPARMGGWIGKEATEALAKESPDKDGIQRLPPHLATVWGPNADSRLSEQMHRVRDIHHGSMEIYNSILPFAFNKFLSKYGAKIRPGTVNIKGAGIPQELGLVPTAAQADNEPDTSKWKLEREIARAGIRGNDHIARVLDEHGNIVANLREHDHTDAELINQALHTWRLNNVQRPRAVQVPVIELNDKLRDAALNKGFPLFARRWTHGAKQLGNAVNNGNNQFNAPQPSLSSRFWNYLVYHAQDKFIDVLRTQNAVAAWRGAVGIPDSMDTYLKQTLYHGRTEQRIAEFEKNYVEPLIEKIKASGYDWTEVEDYLYARHAPEANARIAAINPGQPQYNSGMTDVDAQAAIAAYAATPNYQQLLDIGTFVDTMTKFSRDTMVMEGLEDPDVIAAWEQTYQHYVPLKGWAGTDIDTDMPKRGRGFDVGGKLTKMRTGRTSRAATILANVVAQAQSTIILAEKAKVGRALYDFVKSTPAPDLWAVDQVEYLRYVDPSSGLVRSGVNPSFKLADNILRVRQNGQDYHITFNPENEQMVRLAAALKNLGADRIGPIFTMLHGINRVLSSLNTSLNPEFVVTNALRDLTTAMANLTEQQRSGLRRSILRDWRKAWWGIRRGERGKSAAWAKEWEEFKRAGGKVGWIDHYKSPQDLEKKLRRQLAPDNVLRYTVKGITAAKDFIENENLAVENAIRLATYVNLRNGGVTSERAAEAAKNLTVNFNRKGELGTVMNSLYLFYNASIQGTARLWQLAKHPKGRYVMGSFVVAGIIQSLLMRAIGGDDDDKEKLYDKIPEHEKEKNIIIMIPPDLRGSTTSGEKPYIKLMLPYGFNTLFYTGTRIGDYFDYGFLGNVRQVNPGADAGHIASAMMGAFSPIGDAEGGLSQFLLPTLADPFVQLADNKSWWGGKIMPEDFDEEAPTPDSQKFFQSVPVAYKDFAAWLNEQTGGTEVTPGALDVSPETLQHWTDFAMGGAGRFATGVINAPAKALLHPDDLTTQEIPFWRKVVGGIGDRQTQESFYAHINELKYVKREIDAVYKMGITTPEGQGRMAFIAKRYPVGVKMVRSAYPSFAESRGIEDLDKDRILRSIRGQAEGAGSISNEPRARVGQRKSITTELSDARKEIRRLEARTGLPAKERAEKIAAQKKLIHDALIEFNKQWNEVEDATFGERHQGKLIEKLGPLISDKKRREQVRTLRESGYPETASLLAALPPIPDRFAREYFLTEALRDNEE